MKINGLKNNYYLAFNDVWIVIDGFTDNTSLLEIVVTNLTTGISLKEFQLSPSPDNDFEFNICIPVRNLFPKTDHINVNSLQSFKLDFKVKFEDTNIADEVFTIERYFVRGGRNKSAGSEWFLTPSQELIIGKWIEWRGITLPGYAKRIQANLIVDYVPTSSFKIPNPSCDYKILKFLNSLGGYQFFLFEKWEIKRPTKAGKKIIKKTNRLRSDNFKNTSIENSRTIEFHSFTPWEIQEVFAELVDSPEVFLFHPEGNDNESKWELLELENNESIENNWTRKYENKVEYSFSNYFNKII